MSKIIQSPSKRWPGTITLFEPMSYPQLLAWRTAVDAAGEQTDAMASHHALIPGVLACVERWELGGDFPTVVTAENFPATPIKVSVSLVGAIAAAVSEILNAEDEYPNG